MHLVRITKIRIHKFDKNYEGIYIAEFGAGKQRRKLCN